MDEYQIHNPVSKNGVKTPEEAIKKIRYDPVENLYVFKNGRQIRRFVGEVNRITIENIYLKEMKDAVIVHNHPQGAAFSIEDIRTVCSYEVKELILVTHNFIHQITRPETNWGIDFANSETQQRYEACVALAEDTAMKAISMNEISLHEKDVEIIHYIWASFFQLSDVKYVRKKIL